MYPKMNKKIKLYKITEEIPFNCAIGSKKKLTDEIASIR